jgi:peroxiredoxin Q/BCP
MSEPLAIGAQAPDFSLPATGGRTVSLGDYRGRQHLILVFYVGDNTPDCNRQLASLQEDMAELEACQAAVVGINTGALADHERYVQQLGLSFPLLYDSGAQVAALYGARQDDGTVRRTVYLIDKQGVVRYGKPGMHWNEEFFTALGGLTAD